MIIVKGGYKYVDFWALNYKLIHQLRTLNDVIGHNTDICVHCGVEGQHSPTGFHPKGEAVDLHFERSGEIVQPEAMLFLLIKKWEGGIGICTGWNNPGFHLDIGPTRTWWKKDNVGETCTLAEYVKEKGLNEYFNIVT